MQVLASSCCVGGREILPALAERGLKRLSHHHRLSLLASVTSGERAAVLGSLWVFAFMNHMFLNFYKQASFYSRLFSVAFLKMSYEAVLYPGVEHLPSMLETLDSLLINERLPLTWLLSHWNYSRHNIPYGRLRNTFIIIVRMENVAHFSVVHQVGLIANLNVNLRFYLLVINIFCEIINQFSPIFCHLI